MPRGTPDWYNAGQSNIAVSLSDMGELAVRLGSPVSFDRSGKTIYFDEFSHFDGLYTVSNSGGVSDFQADTARYEYGGGSAKAVIGVGTANWCNLTRYFRMWGGKYLSCEIALNTDYIPNILGFTIDVVYQGILHYAIVKIIDDMKTFQVFRTGGVYETFKTFTTTPYVTTMFNVLRLIYDIEEETYVGFTFNDQTFSLTDYVLHTTTDNSGHKFLFTLVVFGHSTQQLSAWLDRIIISEDI